MTQSLFTVLDQSLARRILLVSEVDARDGFWWEALSIDYAVIGTPTPFHLRPGSQRTIEYPSQAIRDGTGIGAAFVDTGLIYHLDDGVTARVYKRMRAVTADEMASLAERFFEAYPNWRKDRVGVGFGIATADIEYGAGESRMERIDSRSMILGPGDAQATSIRFHPNDWFRPRQVNAYIVDKNFQRCTGDDPLRLDFTAKDDPPSSHMLTGGPGVTIATPQDGDFLIAAFPNPGGRCRLVMLEFDFDPPKTP